MGSIGVTPTAQRVRVGFLIASVGMAALLMFVAISTWTGARQLGDAVSVGQASIIRATFLRGLEPTDVLDSEILRKILSENPELGVAHIGVYRSDGSALAGAGQPVEPLNGDSVRDVSHDRQKRFETGGQTIVRMGFPLPPIRIFGGAGPGPGPSMDGPPGGGPPGAGPPGGGPPGAGPPSHRPGPKRPGRHLIIEFEPSLARALVVRANRSLAVGIAGALLMLLAAVGLWRLSLHVEISERRSAQQRQLAALGEMSAVVAHELRNPLASLKGHAQLLEERLERLDVDERTRRKVGRVVQEAQRLEVLSSGLLTFVRLGEIEREAKDPKDMVEAALAGLERERVHLDLSRAPARWVMDSGRMQQVLTNIIDNALQVGTEDEGADEHTTRDTRVDVRVFTESGACIFEVRDRGPGVPVEARERIFEPFHTTRTRGTGLGLAVSRRIVELHGGTIGVDGHPEGGAVFRVAIPKGAGARRGREWSRSNG